VNQSLPISFRTYLDGLAAWFGYLEEFRHALAHRIPLYIPPHTVSPTNVDKYKDLEEKKNEAIGRRDYSEYDRIDIEQMALGKFTPAMTHSHTESSGLIAFHAQVIADWNTIAELAERFFETLSADAS
jgi:hypothetical protein